MTNPRREREAEVRAAHRARMQSLGNNPDSPYFLQYEREVVGRIMLFEVGLETRPVVLHGAEEIGTCVDCDAARLLEEMEA